MTVSRDDANSGLVWSPTWHLLLASAVALYLEVLLIRYLATEVRLFAYLKNFPLIAAFLGLGVGMMDLRFSATLHRAFPAVFSVLCLGITLAAPIGLTHIGIPPGFGFWVFGSQLRPGIPQHHEVFLYIAIMGAILTLLVALFMPIGRLLGDGLKRIPGLRGYGINLLGSLLGLCLFTALSFLWLPPTVWLLIGVAGLAPFFWHRKLALSVMVGVALFTYNPSPRTTWSPYYRIDLSAPLHMPNRPQPHAYFLSVNHHYHQKMVDLTPAFLQRYPNTEPNRSAVLTYELPYKVVARPRNVLIVGAGTGNDVAAALRNGATNIDAVEIDPAIVELGRRHHPEQPYASDRVRVHVQDARAFFRQTTRTYDLIIFAYLDAHTMLTSFSSLRLDDYVYTQESLREARSLLAPGGTLTLAFSGVHFVHQRLYAMLTRTFDDVPPHVYFTGYDGAGLVFVSGAARAQPAIPGVKRADDLLAAPNVRSSTDRWPFLYLETPHVPVPMLLVLLLMILGARRLVRAAGLTAPVLGDKRVLQFLLLGAGFLLLQTKGITEVSLLFGSTWMTTAVVIAGFLLMALLANMAVALRPWPIAASYVGLFAALLINAAVPYTAVAWLPLAAKILAAACLVGLPVFFSGLVFSTLFRTTSAPAVALGANLLGATVGGALETMVMIGGTPILALLSIALYAGSAYTTSRTLHETAPVEATASPQSA